jgi:hypothetical protein
MKKPLLTLALSIIGFSYLFAHENHPVGARSVALSHAFISISDPWSTFHNQAGISRIEKFTAGIFHESKFMVDELSLTAGSIIVPAGAGVFGISFFQFGKNDFKENKLGITYAKKLTDNLDAAIQFDYFSNRFPENSKTFGFMTFEAGLIYSPDKKLFIGGHIFNPVRNGINTSVGKQKASIIFRFGGHYQFDEVVLLILETQKDLKNPFLIKSGIEFFPVQNLALRFGISGKPMNYTFGLGYTLNNITTDIGFSYHGNLGITPSVSIQFKL